MEKDNKYTPWDGDTTRSLVGVTWGRGKILWWPVVMYWPCVAYLGQTSFLIPSLLKRVVKILIPSWFF
jgi:hypothetical protein